MKKRLQGKKVAILVAHGFDEIEMNEPRTVLERNGAETFIVSPERGQVKSWKKGSWSKSYNIDVSMDEADGRDYDFLLLPGGVINPDRLRRNERAIDFVKHFLLEGKHIAAICHGPLILVETDMLQDRKLTSFNAIKTDLLNAGVQWVDKDVVVDRNLITSRGHSDLDPFCEKIIEEFSEELVY